MSFIIFCLMKCVCVCAIAFFSLHLCYAKCLVLSFQLIHAQIGEKFSHTTCISSSTAMPHWSMAVPVWKRDRLKECKPDTAKPISGLAVPHEKIVAWRADTAKPKSGLVVPPRWLSIRKNFLELYAIGTLHNLSVGEELGLGLNFYQAFTY